MSFILKGLLPFAGISLVFAQQPGETAAAVASRPELKAFEAAVAMGNSLTSWAFVMIGGSIVVILGTSYYRPTALWIRSIYFLFIPGWYFLAESLQSGTRIQGVYLAALLGRNPDFEQLRKALNHDALAQMIQMERGLVCFAIWLILYLFWWILNKEPKTPRGRN